VFSPDGRAYDVSVRPQLPQGAGAETATADKVAADKVSTGAQPTAAGEQVRTVVSWLGLPGEALGGMERGGTPGLFQGSYRFTPQSDAQKETPRPMTMEGVPIQVWSSKSFTARWSKPADSPAPAVECDLPRSG